MKMKNESVLWIVLVIVALALIGSFGFGGYGGYGGMMGGYGRYGSGMMFFGWLTYLLVIALIIAAIYWLIKSANRKK